MKTLKTFIFFERLPIEIQLEIFAFFSVKLRLTCAKVSKSFKKLADNELYWKKKCLYHREDLTSSTLHPIFENDWKSYILSFLFGRCICCRKKTACDNEILNVLICKKCEKSNDKFKTITVTECKKLYKVDLLATDLKYHPYINRYNMMCRNYLLTDVKNLIGEDKMENALMLSKQRSEKLLKTKKRKYDETVDKIMKLEDLPNIHHITRRIFTREENEQYEKRKSVLIMRLKNENLILRDDSQLCDSYINGEENDIEEVISTMKRMKGYHGGTNFSDQWNAYTDKLNLKDYEELSKTKRQEFENFLWKSYIKCIDQTDDKNELNDDDESDDDE